MPIINFEDIIKQGNPFKELISFLELLDTKIEQTKKNMQSLETTVSELNKTGSGAQAQNLINNTEKLSKETEQLTALEKARLQIENQIISAQTKLSLTYENQDTQLRQIKLEQQKLNKEKQDSIKLNSALIGAYEKESITLNNLRKQYKDLALSENASSKELNELLSKIQTLDTKLKKVDASVGQYQRNVGNYTSAWGRVGATLKDLFLAGGIFGLVTIALSKVKQFFTESIGEAEAAQKSYTKVEQAIKSTGGAAGYTTKQLKDFDDELERSTNIDADQIMTDVTGNLLTFTKVVGEQFPRAQKVILDTSVALNQDLKSSTIQVGKALNDPIKGITALSRVGVAFSATQKEMIKNFVKTGEVAKAQDVILKELETEFGGQAEAAAKAGLGPWQKLGIVFDNIKELIGTYLIPLINKFAEDLISGFDILSDYFTRAKKYIYDFINGWIDLYNESIAFRTIIETISTVFTELWDTMSLFFKLAKNGFSFFGKQIAYVFNPKNWGAGFSEGLAKIVTENLKESSKEVNEFFKKTGKNITDGINNSINGKKEHLKIETEIVTDIKPIGRPAKNTEESVLSEKDKNKLIKEQEDYWKEVNKNIEQSNDMSLQDEQIFVNDMIAQQELLSSEINTLKDADLDREKARKEEEKRLELEKRQIISDSIEQATAQLAQLAIDGNLTFKEFTKTMIVAMLDAAEKMLFIGQFEIFLKSVATNGLFGIAKAALLSGLVKGAFAIAKAKVLGLKDGTDYVQGEGTETSDSIPARLSKGEGVAPAHINKQLLRMGIGVTDKRLPGIVANGLNTQRLESLLEEVKAYSSMSAFYLSNGGNYWIDTEGYMCQKDWKTGQTIRIRKND